MSMIHLVIAHLIHMVNHRAEHVSMCHPVIAHWIYTVNHEVEHDSMHRPFFSQGWVRLQDVQAVGQGMRPIEMEITSIRAMGE